MPKFKISYGIRGDRYEEEVIDVVNEDSAWTIANEKAEALVFATVERLEPLTEWEIDVLKQKVISNLLELPIAEREKLLDVLVRQTQKDKM